MPERWPEDSIVYYGIRRSGRRGRKQKQQPATIVSSIATGMILLPFWGALTVWIWPHPFVITTIVGFIATFVFMMLGLTQGIRNRRVGKRG